jgi:hypothetical protein
MISLADATIWKAPESGLPFNVTVSDGTGGVPDRDSDIDNGVIAHEYGHGISNRLTGGPATVSCLSTVNDAEQMGEGWSDYLALVLTHEPGDTATTSRGIGTYVIFEPESGIGIRPTQYTTNMAINPSTYDTIKDELNISEPHGVGYVWATMLWEVYWNLIAKHGYNSDVYAPWSEGGNNLAIQLVFDGMKLQRCLPSFVDGRNGILQAELNLTGGANQCEVWNGFAKRGLGTAADDGVDANPTAMPPVRGLRTDGTQSFALPTACTMAGFFGGVRNDPAVNRQRAGSVVPVTFSLGGDKGLNIFDPDYPKYQTIDCDTKEISGGETSAAAPGGSTLTYDAATDRYSFNWRTDRSLTGCKALILQFADHSRQVAYFDFGG